MKLLVKIYEHNFIKNIITQELIDSQLVIDDDIRDFSVATFTLPIVQIEEDNMVEIYEIGVVDTLIFRGFVYKINPVRKQFGLINIECRSEKALALKRTIINDQASYNVTEVASLPSFPLGDQTKTYFLSSNINNLFFISSLQIPEEGSPYYQWGSIAIDKTTFLITDGGDIKKIENGSITTVGTGSGLDISQAVSDLLDDYTQFNEYWGYDIDFNYVVDVNNIKGDTWFDYFDELASLTNSIRDIQDNKLIFRSISNMSVGSGNSYNEITYNGLYPNSSNISSINVIGNASRSNIVIGQDQNNNRITVSDFVDRVYGVDVVSFRDGKLYDKTSNHLANINKQQRLYQVTVESNTLDAKVGELVRLSVENTNKYFDISTDVMILGKTTNYNNGSKSIEYKVGDINVITKNTKNFLYGIQKAIKLIKL